MSEQSDIRDILGEMQNGPMLNEHRKKIDALMRHFATAGISIEVVCDGRHLNRGCLRRQASQSSAVNGQEICARTRAEISGLRTARSAGDSCMSKFADDLQARIDIINRMITHAKTAERRTLQKERADLEAKLAKVAA